MTIPPFKCPQCGNPVDPNAQVCPHCGLDSRKGLPPRYPLMPLARALMWIGGLLAFYFFFLFSTSAPNSDTLNLGLLTQRQIGVGVGLTLWAAGFAAFLVQRLIDQR